MKTEHFKVTSLWCGQEHGILGYAPGAASEESRYGGAYDFIWIASGKITFHIDRKAWQVGPGTIVLVQPGQTFAWEADPLEPATGRFFRFGLSAVPSDWPEPHRWPVKREMPAEDILRPLFEYVAGHGPTVGHGAPSTPLPDLEIAVRTTLAAFVLGPVERSSVFARSYPQPVQRVLHWMVQLMDSTPGRKVSLEDLADVGGVSTRHLCQLFHDCLGHAPLEVLYLHRVTRSLSGLRSGQKIDSLAHELGFANGAHLAKRFRAVFGKSPTEMRKSLARGGIPKLPRLPFE